MDEKRKKTGFLRSLSQWRTKALFIVFLIISVAMLNRLYFLQIVRGDYYSALALGQNIKVENLPPRGNIYFQDKAGESRFLAAANKEVPFIYANPAEIEDEENVLSILEGFIEFEEKERGVILSRLFNKSSSYALIKKNITEEQAKTITELKIKGVYVKYESTRLYPAGQIASHVLGFLGFEGDKRTGQYGVEESYEAILSGNPTNKFSLTGLFSDSVFENSPSDIELTIDYGAQFVVEKKLAELVSKLSADSATAIFMDPKTGAIIVMANYPEFDPNTYNKTEDLSIFNNLAVQSVFEPGSSFKPITISAAMDGGAVTSQTTYEDTGSVSLSGYTIRNSDNQAHGIQTMTQVLEKSLNTGVIFAQQELGKKGFREYLENFGLDEKTQIDLPGEAENNMDNIKNTNRDINFATASFGQGISLTPMRLLASISAIANNGVIMKPYVVKRITNGVRYADTEPKEMANPISSMTASRLTTMMVSVVDNGFGSKAAVPGYSIAGKTGTAQVPDKEGSGYSSDTIHSFVGFAPAYNPQFAGIIKVDNPRGINFAADSIAPVFGELASFLLQYYKIPPQ
ncbi:MAG: penicillin-binding protein 2 [Candidatus Spechtbacterales bacterium]